jgi:hypothetical protein
MPARFPSTSDKSFTLRTGAYSTAIFFAVIGASYLAILLVLHFLRFPFRGDEHHFWDTTLYIFQEGHPSLDRLRTYNELMTPLPFLVFGMFDHWFHGGVVVGRYINYFASFAVVTLIGAAGRFSIYSLLCAIGLMTCPYFLAVSTHLYTDALTICFLILAIFFDLKNRPAATILPFILAISCRQYVVVFPIAIIGRKAVAILRDLVNGLSFRLNILTLLAPTLAITSLGAWAIFFGAMAPTGRLAVEDIEPGRLFPPHGLYSLACVGLYFVIVEALLFWSFSPVKNVRWPQVILAVIITLFFILYPPLGNLDQPIQTMGYLDRAARLFTNETGRLALFWLLAMLTCFRFSPLSFAGIIVYLNAALMVLAHVAWDKYALPMLAVLWLLKASGRLDDPAWD